jgi:predicted permease
MGSTKATTSSRAYGNAAAAAALPEVEFRRGSPDYFRAMGMPMLRGRGFLPGDRPTDPAVIVINQTMARVVFGTEDAVGKRLQQGPNTTEPFMTVVGVVGDVHHSSLETAPPPEMYINMLHSPANSPFIAVRTTGDPVALVESLRAVAKELDPRLVLYDIRTMSDLRNASLAERRFVLTLVSGFGLLALLLAVVGVYGVLALVVAERTSEMGLRMALGAAPGTVIRLVVGQALKLSAIGIAIGMAIAVAATTATRSVLIGVTVYEPATYIVVPANLLVGAAAAAAAPSRRAQRAEPAAALRA